MSEVATVAVMKIASLVVSILSFSMIQQTYPSVSFMGQTLVNHSYANLSRVGHDVSGSVQCITDLATYCSAAEGDHRGDWYFSDGTRLPLGGGHQSRLFKRVDLRNVSPVGGNPSLTAGLYRCAISTIAAHDDTNTLRAIVYVGLYYNGGGKGQLCFI